MSGGESFSGATLGVTDVPTEKELAARFILRTARDAKDEALLMDAVFDIAKPVKPAKGARPKPVPPPKPPLKPCGTPAAYRRHVMAKEDACDACKAAIAKVRADERARRRLRNPPPGGTPGGKRKGPVICAPGARYEPAGYRVGRCGNCGQLAATHIVKDGAERMMAHPLHEVDLEVAA